MILPTTEWAVFKRHNINTDDIEVVADGKTFFWRGRYEYDLNTAHTLETQLNVFETFQPKPSEESKNSRLLFLANILPMLQKEVRDIFKSRIRGDGHDEFLD